LILSGSIILRQNEKDSVIYESLRDHGNNSLYTVFLVK